jgi:N-acylneuraminate cytidylyltransferase
MRCDKLGLPCRQALDDKLSVLDAWLGEQHISREEVVYLGNDVNDLACLSAVGGGVAVADAHPGVLRVARIQLFAKGGQGAIREVADLILQQINRGA